jgi:hypothetical protein
MKRKELEELLLEAVGSDAEKIIVCNVVWWITRCMQHKCKLDVHNCPGLATVGSRALRTAQAALRRLWYRSELWLP